MRTKDELVREFYNTYVEKDLENVKELENHSPE